MKLDAERLWPPKELPIPKDKTVLRRVIGLISYYSLWIPKFSDKIRPLIITDTFPFKQNSLKAFNGLKDEIGSTLLHSIDENIPLIIETDASDTSVPTTLNKAGRPIAFFSRTLTPTERKRSSVEKEACAIVESIKKGSQWQVKLRYFCYILTFAPAQKCYS